MGRLVAIAEQRLRLSRKDDGVHDWCDRSNVSNRRLGSQQPCARSTTHYLSPPDTLLDERFRCGRSRSPAAKARRDTPLKPEPKPFCCVKPRRDHYLFVVALGCCESVFLSYSLTTPPSAISSIWPVTL
jgi:hypothetical protein